MTGRFAEVRDCQAEHVSAGRYPVIDVTRAWELWSMLAITTPGIRHHYEEDSDGQQAVWMLHRDGSWAHARAAAPGLPPVVRQGGPRLLWDELDLLRGWWLRDGSLPAYGASAEIAPDGTITLRRGKWQAMIGPEEE